MRLCDPELSGPKEWGRSHCGSKRASAFLGGSTDCPRVDGDPYNNFPASFHCSLANRLILIRETPHHRQLACRRLVMTAFFRSFRSSGAIAIISPSRAAYNRVAFNRRATGRCFPSYGYARAPRTQRWCHQVTNSAAGASFAEVQKWCDEVGVKPGAPWTEIRRAFYAKCKLVHPDRNKHLKNSNAQQEVCAPFSTVTKGRYTESQYLSREL